MQEQASPTVFAIRFISYAQNYEDVMLRRALHDVLKGFYIDIGAQSPDTDSVTKAFSLMGWRGINVEPHPVYLERLQKARPEDVNLGVAVGDQAGRMTMNLVGDTGLSTADAQLARRHEAAGHEIRSHDVPLTTLDQIWREHVPPGQAVHFLKVDVEGLEQAVLAGNDWQRNRPWIVLVEAMLPNEQIECHEGWDPILMGADYAFVYADGLNRFYVAREHEGLAASFRYPPNVFDGFVSAEFDQIEKQFLRASAELGQTHERLAEIDRQIDAVGRQAAELNRSLNEAHRRIEHAEASGIEARKRALALEEQRNVEHEAFYRQILERDRNLQLFAQRAEAAERDRDAVTASPWWRISAPVRRAFPPESVVARQSRKIAKAAFWAATPWKLPARLEERRARVAAAHAAATEAAGMPPLNLYASNDPSRVEEPPVGELPREIPDRETAARWCLALLRAQPEIRARFPRALSDPEADGFTAWIEGEGGERFGLSPASRGFVVMTLRDDFGGRVRGFLQARRDVLAQFPDGLRQGAQAGLYRWFVTHGCAEGGISRDEVLWLMMESSEQADETLGERLFLAESS